MKISNIIDLNKVNKDGNGIYCTKLDLTNEEIGNQKIWEQIYSFNSTTIINDRNDFVKSKLNDHVAYLEKDFKFKSDSIYLEIGCGPSYIAEYLMKKYNCFFIGVDFNYPMLVNLDKYFKKKKFNSYVLLYADILNMPIKKDSIDFIYGGGVIEHFKDTQQIVSSLYTILRKGGVSFNTVPAFNLFWLTRFWNNIPSLLPFRKFIEFIQIKIFNYSLLNKYHGYELSFTRYQLDELHKKAEFREVKSGSFAFHPSERKMPNKILRKIYYALSKKTLFSPVYFIVGKK
jgi:ubiquinone/menaquinone biosynthesis C-methylase UbiE